MTRGAAIYGAGGHARVVASILKAQGTPILGFFDDTQPAGDSILGAPILACVRDMTRHRDQITTAHLAVGDNIERAKAYKFLASEGFAQPPLIHPSALVEQGTTLGDGSVICIGAIVATEASLARGCILNTGCCLDHESSLGDFVHLAPRSVIAGRTTIGELSFVGMGATVAQGLTIGRRVAIGANAVVLRDVPEGAKVVGVHH